jgi:hypothetical protein
MSDINDRLAALDPAAHDPYRARNLDEMITRIVASSPSGAARSAWWQRVQLRIAGTLILGTLIGAGTAALVAGGPNLAALAIQTNVAHHPGVFASAENVARPYAETDFVPAASLTKSSAATPSTSPSFKLSLPADGAREAVRLASVFHIMGAARRSGSNWTVTSSSGAALDYQTSGTAPQWYFSSTTPKVAPATATSSVVVVMPSHATLSQDALVVLKRLGFDYSVASPVYSESTLSTTGANGAPSSQSQEEVSYTVTVRGLDTDQSVTFSVDAHNTLVYAQGPAFNVRAAINYPLQGPLDGVSALNTLERAAFPLPAEGTSAPGPTIVHARLSSASISLATFRLQNGTSWLLPLYTFTGRVAQKSGTPARRTWSEIAIKPSFVRLSPSEARSLLNN